MKKENSTFGLVGLRCLFALVVLLVINHNLIADQNINFTPVLPETCPNDPHVFSTLQTGVAISSVTIPKIEAINGTGTVTMTIRSVSVTGVTVCSFSGTPCTAPVVIASVGITFEITDAGESVTITGTPTVASAGNTVNFTIRANTSTGQECDKDYAFAIRKPIDLVMVYDLSGSMGWSFDGTDYTPPAGERRWDGLVTGVNALIGQLSVPGTALTDDRIGIRYFSTTAITPAGTFNPGLVLMSTNLANVNGEISAQVPSGWTALGDGILAGKSSLLPGTAGSSKAMIVFSDGMQNIGDMVQTVGVGSYIETIAGIDLNGADEINIHTICLGSSGHNPLLMESIALNNGGGEYLNSTDFDGSEFMTISFQEMVVRILSGSSPQFIDVRKGQYSLDPSTQKYTTTESFRVNKGVSNVFVVLTTATKNEPIFQSVIKDGVELIQYIQQKSGRDYRSFYITFPIPSLPLVKPNGEWKIKSTLGTRPETRPAYTISMTVEDPMTDLDFTLGGKDFKIGSTLEPTVSFSRLGAPITSASAQAFVFVPGDDINNLVALANVNYSVPPGNDTASPNIYKLGVLLQDSSFLAKIKALNRTVTLNYNSSTKKYSGTFSGLDVAGVYQVIFKITNNDPIYGATNRYYQKSFNVRFKDIVLDKSNVLISNNPQTGNSIITFRPISSTGKLIGSGWGPTIGLNAPSLKIENIKDRGDGTYQVLLNGKASGNGKLTLYTETFYDGELSKLPGGSKSETTPKGCGCAGFEFPLILLGGLILSKRLNKRKK